MHDQVKEEKVSHQKMLWAGVSLWSEDFDFDPGSSHQCGLGVQQRPRDDVEWPYNDHAVGKLPYQSQTGSDGIPTTTSEELCDHAFDGRLSAVKIGFRVYSGQI